MTIWLVHFSATEGYNNVKQKALCLRHNIKVRQNNLNLNRFGEILNQSKILKIEEIKKTCSVEWT